MRSRWLWLALPLVLSGCGRGGRGVDPFGHDVTYKFPTETRDASRDGGAPKLAEVDKKRWAEMNAFALRATRELAAQEQGNVAFCPVGAWSAGAVLLNASNGEANEAAAAFLGLKDPQLDALNQAQQAWNASLSADGAFKQGLGVFMIWPILVTHEFQDSMARDYRADVLKIGSAGEGATNTINAWASRRTDGAVKQAVGQLSKQTIFEILHVAAFRDKWAHPFEPGMTSSGTFTREDGRQVTTPFMTQEAELAVVDDATWSGCSLPFEGGRFAFVVLLPKTGTVASCLASAADLPSIAGPTQAVTLTMPSFEFEVETDLVPLIAQLGGKKLLSPPNDFRRMSIELDEDASVGRARQSVSVMANESGFTATAVTEVEGLKGSVPPSSLAVKLDRPFFWGVVDVETGVYVFTGTVRDPTQD